MWLMASLLIRLKVVSDALTDTQGRYGALDGFRGMLASGVFVHHTFIAYVYFLEGKWAWSASPLLNHLGETTVGLFFMITGFLFTLKATSPVMNWRDFYLSRAARLAPLYFVVVGVLFVAVGVLTQWRLVEPVPTVLQELVKWLAFACLGLPNVNGYPQTWTLIAGVNWTLKYEVIFYLFGVPLIYLGARVLSPRHGAALVFCLLVGLLLWRVVGSQQSDDSLRLTHFVCGTAIGLLYRRPQVFDIVRKPAFKLLACVAALALLWLPEPYGAAPVLVTLILFAAVSGGLSFFGLLQTWAALWLGEVSFGIYLMHGLALTTVLFALRSGGLLAGMGLVEYSALMALLGCVIVALASLSYIKLERPAMAWCRRIAIARRAAMTRSETS
jgi:peptidoglycan/LPS O-acetylase OafA/YrhL